jgi:U3 small nucleolar ribonucleoprotein component
VTNALEEMIKQRVLDEMFDDPIRKEPKKKREFISAESLMHFEKSKVPYLT